MAEVRRFMTAAIAVGCLLFALPVAAHHGWSNYGTEEFSLTGTLDTPVSLSGPHATMKIKDDKGQVWNIVLSAGNRVTAAGLKEGMIPAGATVTAEGHRHRDAKTLEVKTERVKWNGRTFNVYPDRT